MRITEVAEHLHFVSNVHSNWIVYADADGMTVIDSGYPGDRADFERSIQQLGKPEDVRAILLTHAHIDHIGGAPWLTETWSVPVYASEREAAHARREFLEQIGILDFARHILDARWRRWLAGIRPLIAGSLRMSLPGAQPFPDGPELDLPGHPVPIAAPGHTSGHTMFAFSEQRVVVTGDALITGHGTSGVAGPQLLARPFHHNVAEAIGSLDALRGRGRVTILPGHGNPVSGDADELVDLALSRRFSR